MLTVLESGFAMISLVEKLPEFLWTVPQAQGPPQSDPEFQLRFYWWGNRICFEKGQRCKAQKVWYA